MRTSRILIAAVLGACACSPSPRVPPVTTPTSVLPAPSTNPHATRGPTQPPSEVAKQVLAWALVGDAPQLVATAVRVGLVPSEIAGREQLAVKLMLARALGLDAGVGAAIDDTRPVVVGVLDPSLPQPAGALPLVALVPVFGDAELEAVLMHAKVPFLRHGRRFDIPGQHGELHIVIADRYARVAWRAELVDPDDGVAASLRAVLGRAGETPLLMHVAADRVWAGHGTELRALLAHFEASARDAADPELRYAMRAARRTIHFADSLHAVELLVGSDDTGVTVTARADGKPGSAWADYIAAQKPGPLWGLELLPRDAVLVYATHRTSATSEEDADDAVQYVGDAGSPPASEARRGALRQSLARALSEFDGSLVYAMWSGSDGGVGVGGAYRVHAGPNARHQIFDCYRRMGSDLGAVVARAIHLDARRFPLVVRVRPDARRIAGHPVDTVDVSVRWPARHTAEERLFRTLFGAHLELATAFVGEQALFALGHDASARLATMIAAASGHATPSVADDPRFRQALSFHDGARVSFSYLSTARMATFADRLLSANHSPGPLHSARAHPVQTSDPHQPIAVLSGDAPIVSATRAEGLRYEISTRLPTATLASMPRLALTLWRMALSPLLNPPSLPPLPIPPAQVTPLLPTPTATPPEEDAEVPRRRL